MWVQTSCSKSKSGNIEPRKPCIESFRFSELGEETTTIAVSYTPRRQRDVASCAEYPCSTSVQFFSFFFLGRVDTKRGLHVTGHLLARMRENRICTRRGIPSRRYGGKRGVKPERLLLVGGP